MFGIFCCINTQCSLINVGRVIHKHEDFDFVFFVVINLQIPYCTWAVVWQTEFSSYLIPKLSNKQGSRVSM